MGCALGGCRCVLGAQGSPCLSWCIAWVWSVLPRRAGTMVAPHVVAAFHQHLFCARLDMAVDDAEGGKGLVVSEVSLQHVYQ